MSISTLLTDPLVTDIIEKAIIYGQMVNSDNDVEDATKDFKYHYEKFMNEALQYNYFSDYLNQEGIANV